MLVHEATAQNASQAGNVAQVGADSRALAAPSESAKVPAIAKDRGERADQKKSPPQEIEVRNQFGGDKTSRARLSLDPEEHRVFVEIVDSKTGDVITRFPPEKIADHIDSVLEQTDQGTNLEDSGLIFDQQV